jgi:hypothetical protein
MGHAEQDDLVGLGVAGVAGNGLVVAEGDVAENGRRPGVVELETCVEWRNVKRLR